MSIRSTLTEALSRELTLDEMLADPIVRLLMKRDGVSEGELRALMTHGAVSGAGAPAA
ncbi:hypothetical protein [Parvibaculum sp.]|uniref:hypothetical protein n=1 Tax=Parvibaculum sp. TaxID=2024848 RepID=UPI001B1A620F|nr:hypothetical protein [Parvibaculum sp.]MBO6667901.1 hypothetical protein [Parvibaculum sp.]MBO6690514.1 hypothetical protein [Parvibaculum sp.]MBO6714863.1 hypothetical protein [Parvibaculum sp.]